jgi:hypothetical protein
MEKGPVFGLSIGDLLTIYDPDSQSWKMSECLFTGDYARYSEAFPKSGIMLNGRIYEQATWVPRTGGKESGLWPTPNTMEGIKPKSLESIVETNQKNRPGRSTLSMNLRELIYYGERDLQGKPKMWPTPQAIDGSGQGRAPRLKKDCNRDPNTPGSWRADLKDAVKMWPTPVASGKLNGGTRDFKILQNLADCGQITEYERRSMSAGNGGQLNPTWVDWLMGYPVGWTDCADSEMRLSLK